MPQKETRNERFKRIATKRTNDILNQIRILGNCANKSGYDYTSEEVNKIFSTIEKTLKEARGKFYSSHNKKFNL